MSRTGGVVAAMLTVLVIAVSGCGAGPAGTGHGRPAAQLVQDPGQVTPPATAASATPASRTAASPRPAASSAPGHAQASAPTPAPAPSAPQFAAGTTEAPATATLDHPCVTPGGVETLRVSSRPTYAVTYDAQYSDGNDGRKYGGVGTGHLDNSGNFVASWVVQPGAATGNVIVWVSVAGGSESAFRQPTFVVASSC